MISPVKFCRFAVIKRSPSNLLLQRVWCSNVDFCSRGTQDFNVRQGFKLYGELVVFLLLSWSYVCVYMCVQEEKSFMFELFQSYVSQMFM